MMILLYIESKIHCLYLKFLPTRLKNAMCLIMRLRYNIYQIQSISKSPACEEPAQLARMRSIDPTKHCIQS